MLRFQERHWSLTALCQPRETWQKCWGITCNGPRAASVDQLTWCDWNDCRTSWILLRPIKFFKRDIVYWSWSKHNENNKTWHTYISKARPHVRSHFTAIFHYITHNASSKFSVLCCCVTYRKATHSGKTWKNANPELSRVHSAKVDNRHLTLLFRPFHPGSYTCKSCTCKSLHGTETEIPSGNQCGPVNLSVTIM